MQYVLFTLLTVITSFSLIYFAKIFENLLEDPVNDLMSYITHLKQLPSVMRLARASELTFRQEFKVLPRFREMHELSAVFDQMQSLLIITSQSLPDGNATA